jgi:hypothetical protein
LSASVVAGEFGWLPFVGTWRTLCIAPKDEDINDFDW